MRRRRAGCEKRCTHQERDRQASGGIHAVQGLTELKRQSAFIMFSVGGRKVFLCDRYGTFMLKTVAEPCYCVMTN